MYLRRILLTALLWLGFALPANAAVTVTFWSHEFGNSFPHAFFTMRGVPDAGGPPVDVNYGFTAKSVSPAILLGAVPGRIDIAEPKYIRGSDAQFSVVVSDTQFDALLRLVDEWDATRGNGTYKLNSRNCVHFVQEAARRVGLTAVDFPKLMKKPRSFLQAVGAANTGKVILIGQHGDAYLASLPPLAPAVIPSVPPSAAEPEAPRSPVPTVPLPEVPSRTPVPAPNSELEPVAD